MLPRFRRFAILGASLAATLLAASTCQRVPLLAPSGSTITLTSAANALPTNGTTDIIAQVLEAAGTPPQDGTVITFLTTLGSIEPSEARTNGGRVTVKFRAGTANGTANITATSGGATVGSNGTIKIAIGTAAVGVVRVSANPTLLPAVGGSSTITAAVIDINGNPLPGAPVTFSTTSGTIDTSGGTTDANGVVTTLLRTTTAATVTAAVGVQAGSSTSTTTTTVPGGSNPTNPTNPTNPGGTGTASGSVTVNVAGAPTLTITPPATAPTAGSPAAYTFALTAAAANGSPIRDVTVDWGDGSALQHLGAITGNASVSHIYPQQGTYTIVATATDSFGNVVTSSTSVSVNARLQPVVSITASTTNPTAGTDVAFTASVAPPAGGGSVIQDVTADFGDGTKIDLGAVTGANISLHHVYQAGGTYNVILTATDSNGGVGTGFTSVFVQTATPLTVLLSATPTPAGANTTETFTATVVGLGNAVVVNYHWVFGSTLGTADTTSNTVTRTYAAGTGTVTVSVTVTTSTNQQVSGSTVIVVP